MSANNGIYILQSKDGYRVQHCQCIENLNWWSTADGKNWECRDELNPEELISYFGDCKMFETEKEAFKEAKRLYDKIEQEYYLIEYGISFIRGWEDKEFPKK